MIRRVALIGGSFDPPHAGHVMMIRSLLTSELVDEIWISPTGIRRDKKTTATPLQRLVMTELMVNTEFGTETCIVVLDYRTFQNDPYPTIELLEFVEGRYPDHEFYVAIGSDLIDKLEGWYRGNELFLKGKFIVSPRPHFPIPHNLPSNFLVCKTNQREEDVYSSSALRERVRQGKYTGTMVPTAVRNYILRYHLYKE